MLIAKLFIGIHNDVFNSWTTGPVYVHSWTDSDRVLASPYTVRLTIGSPMLWLPACARARQQLYNASPAHRQATITLGSLWFDGLFPIEVAKGLSQLGLPEDFHFF